MPHAPWGGDQLLSVAVIIAYTLAYAGLHSWLASLKMKGWTRRRFGSHVDRCYRLAYNVVAAVLLLPFAAMFVWLPDELLYVVPSPWLWLALLVQAAAAAGVLYGVWITDGWHFIGLRQLAGGECPAPCRPPLVVRGLYRWVRHPLYFLGLIVMWTTMRMTANTAALYIAFSIYLYVGTFFEERRLVAEHGEAYVQYQRHVPRLFPWRGPVNVVLTVPPEGPLP